ncbi:hypothetical protein BC936DRAFT_141780 [Jimgerdemannia flammicorona]|uniref:Uncharacterized protein n=1 Tax=Jimgerdemannia flammicorona TaxID=994334 RepID=A0A433DMK6_9FUNG|nr:hypothetical protein BC936DRAFT_141780 [Jimgerdemannia flammicorona]
MATCLKIITKRPVAQHLKEGVMINIFTNVFEVVMFTTLVEELRPWDKKRARTSTNALLAVDSTSKLGEGGVGVNGAQEYRLELGRKEHAKRAK